MSYIISFLSSALHKWTQGSAPESADGSTHDPAHQLRSQFLRIGLTSVQRTWKDVDQRRAARWLESHPEEEICLANTEHIKMLSEVLFKEGQEPTLDNWNWAIGALEASYDACKDPFPPREETESEDEEDFKTFGPSIRSDLDLMRKIATVDNDNPTQQ